jgi:hypothetical protein
MQESNVQRLSSAHHRRKKKQEVILTSKIENIFLPCAVKRSCNPRSIVSPLRNHQRLVRGLIGQQVALDGKHLARAGRDEAVDLARVLIHLAGVEHAVQTAGLGWKLEQTLPLVLREEGLVESGTGGILLCALLLPRVDLLLLATEHTLVVLVVVDLGVVGLDAVQEEIAVLLQEGIDAEGQVFEVGGKSGGFAEGTGLEGSQGGGKLSRSRRGRALQLVNEGGDQVGVVELDGQFLEDVGVAQVGLLQTAIPVSIHSSEMKWVYRVRAISARTPPK